MLTRAHARLPPGRHQPGVYAYSFEHVPNSSVNTPDTPKWGAFHGSEVPFVFDDLFELTGAGEPQLAADIGGFWSTFARSGAPGNASRAGCQLPVRLRARMTAGARPEPKT